MTIIHQPDRPHICGPNEHGYWDPGVGIGHAVPGTVGECLECGKSWMAYKPMGAEGAGYLGVKWRREGWWARRRRHKREERFARSDDAGLTSGSGSIPSRSDDM